MPDHVAEATAAARARVVALVLLCALIVLAALAVVRGSRHLVDGLLLGAVLLGPALLPLAGIARRERRVYAWATLCLAPHFVYALTELVANPAMRPLAIAMLFVSLALVVALVAYLRLTRPVNPPSLP